LQAQLEGRALSIEENRKNITGRVKTFFEKAFSPLYEQLRKWFSWLT